MRALLRRVESLLNRFLFSPRASIVIGVCVASLQLFLAILFWPSIVALINAFFGGVSVAVAIHHWVMIRPLYHLRYQRIQEAHALDAMRSAFERFKAEMEARGVTIVEEDGNVFVTGSEIPISPNATKH